MNSNLINKLDKALGMNLKVAYVTITKSTGSAPGRVGDTMLVYEDGNIDGTCGGGKAEHTIIQKALKCLELKQPLPFKFELDELGMVCGGSMEGFIDIMKYDKKLIIFGGGHIGNELYKLGTQLDFNMIIVDDRLEYANKEKYPLAETVCKDFEKVNIDTKNAYVVIVTKSHKTDYVVLKALIEKEYKYLGLIGSKKKVMSLLGELKENHIDSTTYSNLYAPIGLSIAKNNPAEIAVSIMAEILLVKNSGQLTHMKLGN